MSNRLLGISGSGPQIGLRMRPDLEIREQQSATRSSWLVKDPVSLRYYTFTPQEFAILGCLDGTRSLEDICQVYEGAYPPQRLTPLRLQSFLADLHENGLLLAEGADQGQLLLENNNRRVQQERWQKWLNWLAIRIPGIDPDRFLTWLYPHLSWCFSGWIVACGLLSMVGAVLLLIVHATELRHQLPTLHEIASPANLVWLALAFIAAKFVHEFGHALTCKHYGGECHEMGILLLVFAPCLYCNVTDSWMLQSRWQRIAVSAAGILVELQLAAIAAVLWVYSQPGVVHTIALNMLVVCSLGTVFFNGNPLLRYDGYFVLADLLEIPNLWQESRAALNARLAKWFLSRDALMPQSHEDRPVIAMTYGLASMAYRGFVVVAILLLLQRILVPHGLGFLIPIAALSLMATAAAVWVRAWWRFWRNPMAWRKLNRGRVIATACGAVVLLWCLLSIPLPCQIAAPALLEPVRAQRVYVSTPGTLVRSLAAGSRVRAGQELARLEDIELQHELLRLVGAQQVAQTRVRSLEARLVDDPDAAPQLEVAKEMLSDVRQQLAQRQRDAQALKLTAAVEGFVMEPPSVPAGSRDRLNLPAWNDSPLEPKNIGCHLERGTLFCLLGDPTRHEAVAIVDENDVQYVRLGQQVRMQFSVAPSTVLTGRVEEIANRNIMTMPSALLADADLNSRPGPDGLRHPVRPSYSVRVALDEHDRPLLIGAGGRAKIAVDRQTLFLRLVRAVRRTFAVDI